jgi:hypothetical protein
VLAFSYRCPGSGSAGTATCRGWSWSRRCRSLAHSAPSRLPGHPAQGPGQSRQESELGVENLAGVARNYITILSRFTTFAAPVTGDKMAARALAWAGKAGARLVLLIEVTGTMSS